MILSDDNLSLSVRYRAVYFLLNSPVIWKQLCCQGQKNFSADKQYKKTHTEKFGKWWERVRLISRLWWHHGSGYLRARLALARWLLPAPPPSRCALWKPREGRALSLQPFLLDPARGFLLITQISNRCAEAKHLIFIPKCFFFKWQMFFKAKKEKLLLYSFLLQRTATRGTCLQRASSSCCLNNGLSR